MIWVKLEKEKDVIIEKRRFPIVDNKLMENNSEPYLDDVCENKKINTLSKGDLGNFDFYLKYDTSDPWINQGRQKSIEISGNTLTIDEGLGIPFFKKNGEKYSIPIDKVIELKNTLLHLNIFQIEKDYPSSSIDGTRWGLSVRFDGKKISSKGHNNYPARWSQIIDAIENCTKYKSLVNIKEIKMINKNKAKKLTMKTIDPNAELFVSLEKNPPVWWENLKNDKEIVIEIRSDKSKSYIDCYYNGGCILKGLDCDRKGNFKGEIHYKYIPITFNKKNHYIKYDFSNNNQKINYNNINLVIPNVNNFDKKTLSLIKKQVEEYYPNDSEKGYQYKFIQKDPYFIDSEFQYNEFCEKDLRIDLVRIDSRIKKIVFIELKKISNPGLFNGGIEEQLKSYQCFITNFESELKKYYLTFMQVKKNLGLLSKEVLQVLGSNFSSYSVARKPLLIIVGCTEKWIKNNAEDIKNRIKKYTLGCYYFGEENKNSDVKKGKNRFIF